MTCVNGRWVVARKTKSGVLYGPTHEAFRAVKGNFLLGGEELFLSFGYHYANRRDAERRIRSLNGKTANAA